MDPETTRLRAGGLSKVQESVLDASSTLDETGDEMMAEIQPDRESGAYQKAILIQGALQTLRDAQRIDERDDLNAASFLEWYDRTLPDVRDIKILAGAMEIELGRRRGERIEAEGERRGGDQSKLSRCDSLLSVAVQNQRKRDRALATEPAAVDTFVQREVTAGRVPTVRGAVKAAMIAKISRAPGRKLQQMHGRQTRVQALNQEVVVVLDRIADDVRRSDQQLVKLTGNVQMFLRRVQLIPWLTIDRTLDGTVFRIDTRLRALCEGAVPRPELSFTSISAYLRTLRDEITRRRKENHDEFLKRRWNSELILKREQTSLLDWIEQQLDRVPQV